MPSALTLIAATVAVVGVAIWQFPERTREVFAVVQTFRTIAFGILALVVAIGLLTSGNPWLMLLGALGFAYGLVWLAVEEPHDTIIAWVS